MLFLKPSDRARKVRLPGIGIYTLFMIGVLFAQRLHTPPFTSFVFLRFTETVQRPELVLYFIYKFKFYIFWSSEDLSFLHPGNLVDLLSILIICPFRSLSKTYKVCLFSFLPLPRFFVLYLYYFLYVWYLV